MTSFTPSTLNYPQLAETAIRRVKFNHAPNNTKNFILGDEWLDTSDSPNGAWWKLATLSTGGLVWVRIGGSTGIVDSFNVDAYTAPGTDPVGPDGTGLVTVTGGQTAPGTISNVIQTDSLALNTYTIEIQQTSAVAAKDVTKNGVSHFNSSQFTNDQGFISLSTPSPFSQIAYQVFTSSGTYTPTSGMKYCIVEVVGAGGGSGGSAATGAGTVSAAGGGGGGEYARGIFTASNIGASKTVTIGAGGLAGSAGNNNGGTGGSTSIGILITAIGGSGGTGSAAAVNITGAAGGVGGTGGTGGQIRVPGGMGGYGWGSIGILISSGGSGGSSIYSAGAVSTTLGENSHFNGFSGQVYGGGASGSGNGHDQVAIAGSAGSAGLIIITEFI